MPDPNVGVAVGSAATILILCYLWKLIDIRQATELKEVIDKVSAAIKNNELIVADPQYTLHSGFLFNLHLRQVIIIGSTRVAPRRLESFTRCGLEQIGGEAKNGESNIPVYLPDKVDQEKARKVWASEKKVVLCIREDIIHPNGGVYIPMTSEAAEKVLSKALSLRALC